MNSSGNRRLFKVTQTLSMAWESWPAGATSRFEARLSPKIEMSDPGPTVPEGVIPAAFWTEDTKGNPLRFATAKRGAVIKPDAVRLVPDRSPDQFVNVNPSLGLAVTATCVPSAKNPSG